MSYLFIDSTYELRLGVLDEHFKWLALEERKGQKSSILIQPLAYELLQKFNIDPGSLKGIIALNGPGFYTGLRLAEGFSDVFSFFGVDQFSFYSYEIPEWCGYKSGVWFTKAYKGEYFFYQWNEQDNSKKLVDGKVLSENIVPGQYFIHSESSLDVASSALISNPVMTTELLKNHPEQIFSQVIKQNLKREPYYFRPAEDEFKANP